MLNFVLTKLCSKNCPFPVPYKFVTKYKRQKDKDEEEHLTFGHIGDEIYEKECEREKDRFLSKIVFDVMCDV